MKQVAQIKNTMLGFLFLLSLTACGGGSGSASPAPTYKFVAPPASSQRLYSKTIIDNSSNTINQSIRSTIATVNADGSFSYIEDDPNNDSVTFNGTNYSVPTETINASNSDQELSYSYTPAGGSLTTCTYAPHAIGPDYPVAVGQIWSFTFTWSCGSSAAISYSQTGTVIDIESVSLPAGTYTALKLQSTIVWIDLNGTTHTETLMNWREINTGVSVKETTSISYSGTVPLNGYPVSSTLLLQSGVL